MLGTPEFNSLVNRSISGAERTSENLNHICEWDDRGDFRASACSGRVRDGIGLLQAHDGTAIGPGIAVIVSSQVLTHLERGRGPGRGRRPPKDGTLGD